MKKSLVLCLMAALAISGCQVKEEGEFASECKPFTATMEAIVDDGASPETKTSMDAGGNVRWKRGDQVSIFAGSTVNEHYQVTDASDGKTAAALNPVGNTTPVSGEQISNNVAFYPYASTAAIVQSGSAYVISNIALPSTQYYAEASFGNGAFPMTAVTSSTSDYNLKFRNVLGGLKVQLKGTAAITSISVTGNNGDNLYGAAEVTVSNATVPAISLIATNAKTVTLDCGSGVQLGAETATAFIIALPPITMSGGFTVTVTDSENKHMEIKTTKSQTITRSNLLSMPAVTYEGKGLDPVFEPVAVDLGLTSGLKWASCNVGASAPEEYGDYFAWGETEPHYSSQDPLTWKDDKIGYYWTNYKFRTSGDSYNTVKFSKYVRSTYNVTGDNKTKLDLDDDAAHVNWGDTWRMPTRTEWTELLTECTWTIQNGGGRLVTGPNGNTIFLPGAGDRSNTSLIVGHGFYWSSSLSADRPGSAWFMYFGLDESGGIRMRYDGDRYIGFSVRPVTE